VSLLMHPIQQRITDLTNEIQRLMRLRGTNFEDWSSQDKMRFPTNAILDDKLVDLYALREANERLLPRRVAIADHLSTPLREAVYEDTPLSGHSSGNFKAPVTVSPWISFDADVINWFSSTTFVGWIEEPVFHDFSVYEEVSSLHSFIRSNLFGFLTPCLTPPAIFRGHRGSSPICIGQPDFIIIRDGKIVAITEIKGNWTFKSSNVVEAYNTSDSFRSAVCQLYHYMRLNHVKYGCITSYDLTSFFRRDLVGTDEILYCSRGISFDSTTPTVLQAFAYFNTLLKDTPMLSPQTSYVPPVSGYESFHRDRFQLNTLIGRGRCNVYLENLKSEKIALKVGDPKTVPYEELQHEVDIYGCLAELQGTRIPVFHFAGYLEGSFCLGLSLCGKTPKKLTKAHADYLLETINRIHQKGIVHGDIKLENIVADKNGKAFLIDFGFARSSSRAEDRLSDLEALHRIL
jgi:Protein kinase domain